MISGSRFPHLSAVCASLCAARCAAADGRTDGRKNMHLEMPCQEKDLTIQQLRDQVAQDTVALQIPSPSRLLELQRQFADKERLLQESQATVCHKLQQAEHKISHLESALEQTQSELLKATSKADTNGSRSDELEMLMTDLDRANQRAVTAEHESSRLRDELSSSTARRRHGSSTPNGHRSHPDMDRESPSRTTASLELELATKDSEISQLVEDIRRLQSTVDSLKESSASEIAQLEKMLSEKTKIIEELEDKLERQRDYDDLKRELRNLKMLEDSENPDPNEDAEDRADSGGIDLVLYDKNRAKTSPSSMRQHPESADSPSQSSFPATRCLQNVEAFGSLLGEEIVSNFSRLMKTEPTSTAGSPPATPKSTDAESTEPSTPAKTPSDDGGGEPASLERLQDCLRQNMERYASEALNTGNISRVVRELLSVHNVGQRLFAKFVLGLSQGTVSELLSKPKPWDKLTEKGRDSYRKMHAWASDEACVSMLKALVPKKGKESGVNPSFRQEDIAAEERIAQILSEAQQAMITPKKEKSPPPVVQQAHQNGSSVGDDSHGDSDGDGDNNNFTGGDQNGAQNLTASAKDMKRARKYENDDIPQEMVARIYQEELAKLMGQRVEESFRQQQYERTHEEIRQALSIYHQELSRLSQLALTPGHEFARFGAAALPGALLNGAFPGLSLGPDGRGPRGSDPTDALRHHGSAFSLVRPGLKFPGPPGTPGTAHSPPGGGGGGPPSGGMLNVLPDGPSAEDLGSSPLQRMQSITNSLLSQNATPPVPPTNQRQAKAVLPPITQQQFDQYNNLNTEDIVKKVKEQLSQYSISQRLFGENVLGLSQGSVSDLLARPKPWHMLTQKGREPFIRMKIFLEDENAVHKLVASQYKIAPEKLMRTTGFTAATSPLDECRRAKSFLFPALVAAGSSKLPSSSNLRTRDIPSPSQHHQRNNCDASPLMSKFNPTSTEGPLDSPGSIPPRSLYQPPPASPSLARKGPQPHAPGSRSLSYMQPSVYEMAALTTDLDTQSITAKIKETLMAHNIGQKIFGEAVLGLSQGSVSELLSKPKPWHMLSIKGREPFIRMQLWLNDPHNVEKLQVIKNERREANKRRRSHIDLDVTVVRPVEQAPLPPGPALTFPFAAPSSPYPAAKKPRVLFSDEQKEALRLAFSMDPYPSTATIEFLAGELNLSVRTITNWFHNHRMRLKQHVVSPSPDDPPRQPDVLSGRDGAAFDPTLFRNLLLQRLTDMHGEKATAGCQTGCGTYTPYNSYSPSSGNEEVTLDLSMSGQNSQGTRRGNATSSAGDRTPSELNEEDDSNLSREDTPPTTAAESSDRDSLHEDCARQSISGHSRRRKPAAPKWVDPGLSPDSEDNEEAEDTEGVDNGIINGVCVRQTDFGLCSSSRETVRVDPAPARGTLENDEDFREDEEGALELCTTRARKDPEEERRRHDDNIRRLERRLERDDVSDDWEF